ncbi:MAG: hypothetical protein J6U26_00560 [Lachnospiraceae bacterium]|nr:hypothetical protein [Lachnospiraceae bacterium]
MDRVYLIDYENVAEDGLHGFAQLTPADDVYLFYTIKNERIRFEFVEALLSGAELPKLHFMKVLAGKQALDIQLATFLGSLITEERNREKSFVVVSKDKGYDCIINFWKIHKPEVSIRRADTISRLQQPAVKSEPAAENGQAAGTPAGPALPALTRQDAEKHYPIPAPPKNGRGGKSASTQEPVKQDAPKPDAPRQVVAGQKAPEGRQEPVKADPAKAASPAQGGTAEARQETPAPQAPVTAAKAAENAAEAPKPDAPKAETPKQDAQKQLPAKAEAPKPDAQKQLPAKAEIPKPDAQKQPPVKAEAPKQDAQKPAPAKPEGQPSGNAAEGAASGPLSKNELNNIVMQTLSKAKYESQTTGQVASIVASFYGAQNAKRDTYTAIIKKFGQKKGLEIYGNIKKLL